MVFKHYLKQAKLEESRSGTRRAPRRAYRRPMGLLFDGEYQVIEGRQLSEGGAMVIVPAVLARRWTAGRSGTLALILPEQLGSDAESSASADERAMVLRAVAIYQNPVPEGVAIGLKFSELPFQNRRMIRNYVAAKSADEVADGGRETHRLGGSADPSLAVGEREPGSQASGEASSSPQPTSFTRAKPPEANEA